MAKELVPVVEPNGVGALQPGHARDQGRFGGLQDHVIVVGHQAISVHLPAGLLACLGQRLDEIVPVHVIQEDPLPPVAPAHDMVCGAGILKAELARHVGSLSRGHLIGNRKWTNLWVYLNP